MYRGSEKIIRRDYRPESSAYLAFELAFHLHPGTQLLVFPVSTYRSL